MLDYYKYKEVLGLFLKGKVDEAKKLLMELQARHIAMADENNILKAQLQEYEDILYIAKNLIFDGENYWLMTGNIKQGPFCPHCYSETGVLIRLIDGHSGMRCPMCGSISSRHDSRFEHEVFEARMTGSSSAKIIPFSR